MCFSMARRRNKVVTLKTLNITGYEQVKIENDSFSLGWCTEAETLSQALDGTRSSSML